MASSARCFESTLLVAEGIEGCCAGRPLADVAIRALSGSWYSRGILGVLGTLEVGRYDGGACFFAAPLGGGSNVGGSLDCVEVLVGRPYWGCGYGCEP